MNLLRALRDHYLRLDARSLGVFRVAFGVVLVADLLGRWRWLADLYSNDGVLPNHHQIFLLRDTARGAFSIYYPFSTVGEVRVAFALTLVVYLGFLAGWHTRAFHALSLLALVSLAGRNILLENAGNYLAIALCAFTLFLPCGSRFSVDALRKAADPDLRGRRAPSAAEVQAGRLPGWSPVSLAAFAALLQLAIVYGCSGLLSGGPRWADGSAFYYALHVQTWVSGLGAAARDLPPPVLSALTRGYRVVELLLPVLLLAPVPWRRLREVAALLMVAHGLTLGVLFDFGLYGWTLVAAAALVLPRATWDALGSRVGARPGLGHGAAVAALAQVAAAPPSPALRLARGVGAVGREAAVGLVLVAMIVQTGQANPLPAALVAAHVLAPADAAKVVLPQSELLAAVAGWPRMLARWDILVDPPVENALLVVDGQTKDGRPIDPLTGVAPQFDPSALRGTGLGQQWNDYLARQRPSELTVVPSRDHPEKVRNEFGKAFRDYLAKSGPRWSEPVGDAALTGFDGYWVRQPIPAPGEAAPVSERSRLFNQGRLNRPVTAVTPTMPVRPQAN